MRNNIFIFLLLECEKISRGKLQHVYWRIVGALSDRCLRDWKAFFQHGGEVVKLWSADAPPPPVCLRPSLVRSVCSAPRWLNSDRHHHSVSFYFCHSGTV